MHNLANTYCVLGRCEEALELFKNALDIMQRVLPENHPQIGHFMYCHCHPPALLLMFSKVMQSMLLVAHTVCFGNIKMRSQLRSTLSVFSSRFSHQIILESRINSYKSGTLLPTLAIFTRQ
jgi:hypothetical protein